MTASERFLQWFLRLVGAAALLAVFCAVMPLSWMDAVHQWLGMGELPRGPIVGYLARSTSAFYALMGGLLWLVSYDLRRYRPVASYLGVTAVLLGLLLFWADLVEGMPPWWTWTEGPINVALGVLIVALARGVAAERRES